MESLIEVLIDNQNILIVNQELIINNLERLNDNMNSFLYFISFALILLVFIGFGRLISNA